MGRYVILITFVVTLQFSAVLCRNPFQEYFYNKYHHKGHSTTASISSSTSDTPSEEITASSVSDYASLEELLHSSTEGTSLKNLLHSSTVDHGITVDGNMTILRYDEDFEEAQDRFFFNVRIVLIIVGVIIFAFGFCCIFCFVRILRGRNTARTGFIISGTQGTVPEVSDQQPVTSQQHQQPLIAQHYPPHYTEPAEFCPPQYQLQPVQQEFPPQYQTQPVQQQFPPQHQTPYEYSPTAQQPHNPPEAPPPYEFPTKF